jgi:hypothetical protein
MPARGLLAKDTLAAGSVQRCRLCRRVLVVGGNDGGRSALDRCIANPRLIAKSLVCAMRSNVRVSTKQGCWRGPPSGGAVTQDLSTDEVSTWRTTCPVLIDHAGESFGARDIPEFEIADVHIAAKSSNMLVRTSPPRNGWYEIHSATMVDLIRIAYGFDLDKIPGGQGMRHSLTGPGISLLRETKGQA